ncbi:MAG: tetratricopeptide repeat protein [Candidatus Hydrogenedentes bacterium]|nr:tetratricopeptide repeat protein [Candidatus Hydrogenedentota bacterium]
MSPGADRDHRDPSTEGDAYVRQQLASIDGSLFNGMPVDDRYESGVPETQRGNSLDFIQMTGLTRPPLRQALHGIDGSLAHTPIYEDLNPQGPLSFYEKGVADVDDTLSGDSLLGGLRDITLDADLIPNRNTESLVVDGGASRSAQAFRDIVAGLQRVEENPSADAPVDAESEEAADLPSDPEEYQGSASGALLALVEELESVMGVEAADTVEPEGTSDAANETDLEIEDEATEPGEVAPEEAPEASAPTANLSAPAAEIDDDDFDALLASLSGRATEAAPEEVDVPAAEDAIEEEPEEPVAPEAPAREDDAPAARSGISDDWDALLDSMTVRGSAPAAVSVPAPTVSRTSPASGALAEAEQLMQALEKRAPIAPPAAPAPLPVVAKAPGAALPLEPAPLEDLSYGGTQAPPTALDLRMRERAENTVPTEATPTIAPNPDSDLAFNYDYSAAPSRRRSRRHSRVARKSRKIVKAVFFLLLLGGLAGTLWTFVIGPMMLQDEDLTVRAERELSDQNYLAASHTYLQLASRMAPGEKGRSDAEFRAAHTLTLGPATSWDETRQRYESALALFKKFTEDYPQHPKRTRALSIMGRLHYELKQFEEAIAVLRDQVKPADDPAAALSMLRYLARSYSMTGNYEQAETSYLQSATLPGNYSAESDYLELGDLFRRRAEAARDGAEREQLKEMAMSYWRRAIQVPGIAPSDRSNLEERLQWLSFAEQTDANATDAVPAAEGAPPAPATAPASVAPAESESVAPVESAIPVPQDESGRAEIPGAELEALVPPAPAPEAAAGPAAAPEFESQ